MDDRHHHFRFIVSPGRAEMTDLKAFTRDSPGRWKGSWTRSLGWIAVDHWNTDNPHVHLILRRRTTTAGPRHLARLHQEACARAMDLVTSNSARARSRNPQRSGTSITTERWTDIDRRIARGYRTGVVDLRPGDSAAARR